MLMLTCSLPLLLAITFSSPLSSRVLPRSDGGSLAPMPLVSDTKSSYIFDWRCFLTLRCTGSPCCEGMKSKELSGFMVAMPLTLIMPLAF